MKIRTVNSVVLIIETRALEKKTGAKPCVGPWSRRVFVVIVIILFFYRLDTRFLVLRTRETLTTRVFFRLSLPRENEKEVLVRKVKGMSRKRFCYVLCPRPIIIIVVKIWNLRKSFPSLCTSIRICTYFFSHITARSVPGWFAFSLCQPTKSGIGNVCSFVLSVYKCRRPTVVSKRVSIRVHTRVVKCHRYRLGNPILRSPVI